jgi:hypothetical protein
MLTEATREHDNEAQHAMGAVFLQGAAIWGAIALVVGVLCLLSAAMIGSGVIP